ncbi:putative tartrate-resistant acid phosphatase type 5 [Trypanosoma grayi]|uniref:putative tartrate-resistant acid phosphatase type 5 n=1 Tax=Trypanosoma grayi TaxID=71804 RepID=UPI0004F47C40|nr:putative tartrate-resistant acid phosphatase type 5 [Trypanosoma grayi]KEG15223.1 putative tartrate-resistant acid phosphatase type 5 [Trypanosoma grayi]
MLRIFRYRKENGGQDGRLTAFLRDAKGQLRLFSIAMLMLCVATFVVVVSFCFYPGNSSDTSEVVPHPLSRTQERKQAHKSSASVDSGARFWLSGSWGSVLRVPDGCWVHPRFESFAFACQRKETGNQSLVVTMELMPLLILHKVYCLACDTLFQRLTGVRVVSDELNSRSHTIEKRGVQIVEVTLPPISVSCRMYGGNEKDEWGIQINGQNPSTCLVRFDILASLKVKDERVVHSVPPICFAAVGDWGSPKSDQAIVINQLTRLMQRHWVKFIVSTGDNFYPRGVRSTRDSAWVNTFERPFSDTRFHRLPFLISVGNHDLGGKVSAQVMYGKANARWFFPAPYFGVTIPLINQCEEPKAATGSGGPVEEAAASCVADLLDVFVMNSYDDRSWGQQVRSGEAFFASCSKDARQHRWRLVVNHEALFSGGLHGVFRSRNSPFRERMLPFVAQHQIHMYLNGDDHLLEVHHFNGTDFFTTGAGGGSLRYQSEKRFPTTVWRPEMVPGMNGDGERYVLGPTLHCMSPFSDVLTTVLYNVSEQHQEEVYRHTTRYKRGG